MRVLIALLLIVADAHAAVPEELADAIKAFRSDPPPGWSYTLTTAGEGKSQVERCNAAKPEFDRWSLVLKDGRPPTPDESRDYVEGRSRRSRGGTAPKVVEQLDLDTLATLRTTAEESTLTCLLKPGDAGDNVAAFLQATIVLHRPTRSITSIVLASTGEFSPTFVVKIAEMSTRMTYSPPAGDRPTLPEKVETHVRGRVFRFKSLDGDLVMTFSDYERARKK